MNWSEWLPFSDVKGFVRLVIGVTVVLVLLRITGLGRKIGAAA